MNQLINQEYNYCNFEDYSVIKEILATVFLFEDFLPVENAYDCFRQKFFNKDDECIVPSIKRENFKPKVEVEDKYFLEHQFLNKDFTVGIDLPVVISNKNFANDKCIFIVGEDPFRSNKGFEDQIKNLEIPLSTPFATHHNSYRNKNGKLYWALTTFLLELGYKVYFTDIKKIWIKKVNSKAKLQMPSDIYEKFECCLKEEIKAFNPSLIITFGKPAKISIQKIESNIQVTSFIHPTFAARKHWKLVLQESNKSDLWRPSNENVLNYMKDTVSAVLSKESINKLIA